MRSLKISCVNRASEATEIFSFPAKLFLQIADAPDLLVRRIERIENDALLDFPRARFDHHDRRIGPGNDEIEIGEIALGVRRIDDDLAIHVADANRADRVEERDLGEDKRGRCRVDGQNIGIVRPSAESTSAMICVSLR
jgi:hypothetical protein